MISGHAPVLLDEALELLGPRPGGVYLDATFGGGGHSRGLLEAGEGVQLIALDRDPAAVGRAGAFTEAFGSRFSFFHINFSELGKLDLPALDGALFDFGVSSFQLDEAERGFSFRRESPADMRMNPETGPSAADFLETAPREELVRAVRDLGEEKQWRRIVEAILNARGSGLLQRTDSLAKLIGDHTGPAWKRKSRLHPATLSFQGIRMAVNRELEAIEEGLPAAFEQLAPGAVLVAISFHSLEDRIVKHLFREWAGRPVDRRDNRSQHERTTRAELLTGRPLVPAPEEQNLNPRSRSARLRALRKL